MSNDSLGDRMKVYEDAYRNHLPIRMPVILRIDGCHFHTYTKGCKKPVDDGLVECMNDAAIALCKNIQGCQMAYVQSDEISLLLVNYKNLDSGSWFENNLQKMVSVSSSIAAATFTINSSKIWGFDEHQSVSGDVQSYPIVKPAYFDSRAFVLPKEEVCNYFIWRQQDATRNSVQMLARSLYSHKQCNNKNNTQLQEMCFQKGVNWNDCPTAQKRGRCIVKVEVNKPVAWNGNGPVTAEQRYVTRSEWIVHNEIPVFSQDRRYIEKYAYPLMITKIPSFKVVGEHPFPKPVEAIYDKQAINPNFWKELDNYEEADDILFGETPNKDDFDAEPQEDGLGHIWGYGWVDTSKPHPGVGGTQDICGYHTDQCEKCGLYGFEYKNQKCEEKIRDYK
jgi:tRNA(His) guanylyltransferase